jgi:hypothetical protein
MWFLQQTGLSTVSISHPKPPSLIFLMLSWAKDSLQLWNLHSRLMTWILCRFRLTKCRLIQLYPCLEMVRKWLLCLWFWVSSQKFFIFRSFTLFGWLFLADGCEWYAVGLWILVLVFRCSFGLYLNFTMLL